jgi:hypothetical protein
MEHRYEAKYSTPFCRSTGTIAPAPADLNGIQLLIAHFILD